MSWPLPLSNQRTSKQKGEATRITPPKFGQNRCRRRVPPLLLPFSHRWFEKCLIRVASAAVPWVLRLRPPTRSNRPRANAKGSSQRPSLSSGPNGVTASWPINKAKLMPQRAAQSPRRRSCPRPTATNLPPADHLISHQSPPGRQHQIPTLLNPPVAVSILSTPDNHPHYFSHYSEARPPPEPIQLSSPPPPPPVDDLMELQQFCGLLR